MRGIRSVPLGLPWLPGDLASASQSAQQGDRVAASGESEWQQDLATISAVPWSAVASAIGGTRQSRRRGLHIFVSHETGLANRFRPHSCSLARFRKITNDFLGKFNPVFLFPRITACRASYSSNPSLTILRPNYDNVKEPWNSNAFSQCHQTYGNLPCSAKCTINDQRAVKIEISARGKRQDWSHLRCEHTSINRL